MNNEHGDMKEVNPLKSIGIFLLKIPIYILRVPIAVFRALQRLTTYVAKSFMYSIRRRLTASFLAIYTLISVFTFMVIITGFMFFEMDQQADDTYYDMQPLFEMYGEGAYDQAYVIDVLERTSKTSDSDIYVYLGDQLQYETHNVYESTYSLKFTRRISAFTKDKVFGAKYIQYVSKDGLGIEGQVIIVQSIKQFSGNVAIIAWLFVFCFLVGFGVIWLFGSLNVKKVVSPLFTMTLTAKKLSINNMEERLDVARAKYELRDLALTLNDMLDRLQADYVKQKRFVSDVSHELRTPISIVTGYANMLERWGKEDEAILDEAIEAIISEAKSMQILVENLLTLVRSDNQTLKYEMQGFDLSDLVREVCKETAMINTKDQVINCDIEGHIEVTYDFEKIKQMLRIFVDNAVKYTPEQGRITIACHVNEGKASIHIKDTGIGISSEDLPYLFDRFYRSDESRTRQTGGHGLGLSIAKVIVLGHGGSIRVKSKLNLGSEFIIELPLS